MTFSLVSSPVLERLSWLVDGLAGRWPAEVDAATVLAPEFAAVVHPSRFTAVMADRATALAPIVVTGIDCEDDTALARLKTRTGDQWVARVTVEAQYPHRITSAYAQPWVPDYLTAALPRRFGAEHFPGSTGPGQSMLMVFGGVPGSGKSAVAERVSASLGVPVFALDWLLGSLAPFGMSHRLDLMGVGEELLTTLAYRELAAGRSAILDTTSEDASGRTRWLSMATAVGAVFVPVVCVCSDSQLHRQRVEHRQRGIPGWADTGEWQDVCSRLARFLPWPGSVLIDTVAPLELCVAQVLDGSAARQRAPM